LLRLEIRFLLTGPNMISTDGPRPTMRRKSSAQNLLSSFKSSSSQSQPNASGSPSLPSVTPTTLYGPSPTSGTSTPMSREWDSQSLQSDPLSTAALNSNGGLGPGAPPLPQGTSVEFLRDLVQKRMITITYVRNVHEGCVSGPCMRQCLILSQTEPLVSYDCDDKSRTGQGVQ
jgi:hypothetical protein